MTAFTRLKNKKTWSFTTSFFLIYTFLFIILTVLIYSSFWRNGKSMIWKPDGLTQHFNAFVYFGNWGKELLKTLLTEHRLSVPLWDFSIGYGSDVLTTLQYYVFGDPFNLLAIFTPARFLETLFNVLILLRVYLCGLAFSFFCLSLKLDKTATLAGALTYLFSGYLLVLSPQHPSFINPMIYLPLLFLGVEKVLHKKSGHLLIAMTALSALTNFYFFYMLVILTVIYCVIRFCTMPHERWLPELFTSGLRVGFFAATGTAIGAILLLPVVLQFLSDSRASSNLSNAALYPLDFYTQFPDALISTTYSSFWTHLGFPGIALLGIFVLFLQRKRYTGLKIGFAVLTLMLLLPGFGSLMNGFSYAVNRWCFGYTFLVSLILTVTWPHFFRLTSNEKCRIVVLTFLYLTALMFLPYTGSKAAFFSLALMLLSVLFILEAPKMAAGLTILSDTAKKRFPKIGVLFLLIIGILSNAFTFYQTDPEGHIERFVDYGEALTTFQETGAGMMSAFYPSDDFSRYAQNPMPVRNDTLLHDVSSIDYYWSLSNGAITQYFDELALPMTERPFKYNRLDDRNALHALAGVEYYVRHNPSDYVPSIYGETNLHEFYGDLYYVSETDTYFPMGYTYDAAISRETYESLPYIRRQQALLQGAVCDTDGVQLTEDTLQFEETSLPFELSYPASVILADGGFYALEGGETLTFTFKGHKDSETYLLLEGIYAHSMTELDFLEHESLAGFFIDDWNALSTLEQRMMVKESKTDIFGTGASVFSFSCSSNVLENEFAYFTEQSESAFDRTDYLLNMGYSSEGQTILTLTLPHSGYYSFENMEILCLPQEQLFREFENRQASTLTAVEFDTNRVSGSISLTDPKILCLSIPYSDGWTAYVDGIKTPILQANTMFMALELAEGEHLVELQYETPGLRYGLTLSACGLLLWGIYIITYKKIRGR